MPNLPTEVVFRHPFLAGVIFVLSFVLISFRRLRILPIGRPSGAMFGAVLMVLFGVVTPEEAYRLVNWDTICLLLGMMILAEHLKAARFFDQVSSLIGKHSSPFGLLAIVSLLAAGLSAILVNDTICIVFTPLLLDICAQRRLKPFPYLIALATMANIGSALTLTGNPQNMIIGTASRISFPHFSANMAAPVLTAFLTNLFFLWLFFRNHLDNSAPSPDSTASAPPSPPPKKPVRRERTMGLGLLALLATCIGFATGMSMAFSALGGATMVILLHRRDPRRILARLEWSLLLFFAGLFVIIGGLQTSGLAQAFTHWSLELLAGGVWQKIGWFSGFTLIGSNLFSNVPYVLLLSPSIPHLTPPDLFWCLLAYVGTLAGNLTLFGSVANLIVAEMARDRCEIGFWQFAAFGVPSTLIGTFLGTMVLGIILL